MSPPQPTGGPETGPPSEPMPQAPAPLLEPPPSDAPSPLGLVVAGAGLILLCVSIVIPRISIEYEDDWGDYGYFGVTSDNTFTVGTSSMVLSAVLLAAVALSVHRSPGLRWPVRLSAVGLAALTAAFAYHPVTVLRQFYQDYQDTFGESEFGGEAGAPEVTVEADSGLYLAVLAVALLAASTFLMRPQRRTRLYYQPTPPPETGPWTAPTVTVTSG
jgi:hypothetical protein